MEVASFFSGVMKQDLTEEIHIPSLTSRDWHHKNCFGCGPNNQYTLGAEFKFDEETGEVRFDYDLQSWQEGAPGYAHGGILATLLDEAQGVLCFHLGHFVMTEELHTHYQKAAALGKKISIRCWITAVRRRRLYTEATIHSENGDLLVSSKAKWYDLSERTIQRMFQNSPYELERLKMVIDSNRRRGKEIRKRIRQARK